MTPSAKAELDALVIEFNSSHHQKHKNSFPKTNFAPGLTNLRNRTVSKWLDILYVVVILAQSEFGWNIINDALRKRPNGQANNVLYVLKWFYV